MGIVYRGRHRETGDLVAIKRLHPEKVVEDTVRERFLREVQFLKALSHPNILPLLAGGEEGGGYFLVTPFVEGGSLEHRIRELPPVRLWADLEPIVMMVIQIARTLHYAHEQGFVHRDVKPANILLAGEHPYLADFGLAKQIHSDAASLTQGAVGTPCYMAPELWQKRVTPQADIYSLGVILYELMAGEYPFTGSTPEQILVQQISSKPRPPVASNSPSPFTLNGPILKALARNPIQRQTSAGELSRELQHILEISR
jgi:serine/threonine-protein kinase